MLFFGKVVVSFLPQIYGKSEEGHFILYESSQTDEYRCLFHNFFYHSVVDFGPHLAGIH